MSAVAKVGTVDQLARALAPHTVLVHHDFSQSPEFPLKSPNVRFVPDPKRTGWGVFGFVEGIFHSLQYAVDHLDFDYLQILSPTCLPIKPMARFEEHVSGNVEVHYDCIDVVADQDALMSVGFRAFTPRDTLRYRIAGRLTQWYFGASPGRRDLAGVWLHSGFAANRKGTMTLRARLALAATRALSRPSIGRHVFDEDFRPYYGTDWIGARRHVIAALVDGFARPGVREYFRLVAIAEEFLIPSLLKQIGAVAGPMNHYIGKFDEAHAGLIDAGQFERLVTTPHFFARKFPDDPNASIRRKVLNELVLPEEARCIE
jgi:hypothetical protein